MFNNSFHLISQAHASTSDSSIQEVVGDGCANDIDFSGIFTTDAGEECNACQFCKGSRLNALFDPNSKGICIDCSGGDKTCRNLRVTTDFKTSWKMKFLSLSSSSMCADFDPQAVIVEGSDNSSWKIIYNSKDHSGQIFEKRVEIVDLIMNNNDDAHKHFRITFQLKDKASTMQVGYFGLVPAYTKQCTANLHVGLTGDSIMAYKTFAPTHAPTANPTSPPCVGSNKKRINNKCYSAYNQKKSWYDAKAYCTSQGLQLSTIESQSEQVALQSIAAPMGGGQCGNHVWTALKSKRTTSGRTEGTWFWDVNPPIDVTPGKSFQYWQPGQQDGGGVIVCGGMYPWIHQKTGEWFDHDCNMAVCFACMKLD